MLSYSNVSRISKIVYKLGIPEPPKKPLNGYLRFQQENRESLQKSSKSQAQLISLGAAQWQRLSDDEKSKYNSEFMKEYVSEIYLKLSHKR